MDTNTHCFKSQIEYARRKNMFHILFLGKYLCCVKYADYTVYYNARTVRGANRKAQKVYKLLDALLWQRITSTKVNIKHKTPIDRRARYNFKHNSIRRYLNAITFLEDDYDNYVLRRYIKKYLNILY